MEYKKQILYCPKCSYMIIFESDNDEHNIKCPLCNTKLTKEKTKCKYRAYRKQDPFF